MHDTHIGDNAELYALGSLDDLERQRVETHVANCADCLRRLGQAEETVLGLERETPEVPLPRNTRAPAFRSTRMAGWWMGVVAAAAALIIGYLLPHPAAQPGSDAVQVAMLHSHFNHSQFVGSGALAKVLYARDRSWYYVVVEGSHAYSVSGVNASGTTPLGATAPRNGTSELFVRNAQPFTRIELREGTTVLEAAQIR
jgi:Putative zinc-finger